MEIGDLDVERAWFTVGPLTTDAPLLVDANTDLTLPIPT